MKLRFKALIVAIGLASVALTTGCATSMPLGLINTMITTPVTVGNGEIKWERTGEASCYSLLGLFAWGDSSINAACKESNIHRVGWVSTRVHNVLGIYGVYTTIVYGQAE
ncbi:MAG: TRL-like protein family [Lentisphaerae bacterium]|nr:TRL-like protein family [Lentisphaerota bacterium]